MERVVLIGGSGFIGRHLADALVSEGYEVVVLSRTPSVEFVTVPNGVVRYLRWDGVNADELRSHIEASFAVVNLAGAGIADRRWTRSRKAELLASRIYATKALVDAVDSAKVRPKVVIQGSAVGFYGFRYNRKDVIVADEYTEQGEGFLAEVCKLWEDAALPLEEMVDRLAIVRTGIVLGKDGGFMAKLLPTFKMGLGGKVGTGMQPLPWIHIEDEVTAISHIIKNGGSGVFNLVAPQVSSYSDLVAMLGRTLRRPTFFTLPEWAVRIMFGAEMANEVLLGGKHVAPKRLEDSGFKFRVYDLGKAIESLVK